MDVLNTELEQILAAKKKRRLELSRKAFPEKIRMLVELQKMLAPLERRRGRNVRVWEIEDSVDVDTTPVRNQSLKKENLQGNRVSAPTSAGTPRG
jgi:hypothetical protein